VQRQVRRLEAEAVAADVDDAALHALERVGHLDHRAAVALDEIDGVLGFLLHPLRDFGDEEALHEVDVGVDGRVSRRDPQLDVFGLGDARAGECEDRRGKGRQELAAGLHAWSPLV
jgi:hypothetical protein